MVLRHRFERRRIELGRGVQHDLREALRARLRRRAVAVRHAQPAGDAGAHRADIERFAFDGAGVDDVLQQRIERECRAQFRLGAQGATEQRPLGERDLAQQRCQCLGLPGEVRPVGVLPDPARHQGLAKKAREPNASTIRLTLN